MDYIPDETTGCKLVTSKRQVGDWLCALDIPYVESSALHKTAILLTVLARGLLHDNILERYVGRFSYEDRYIETGPGSGLQLLRISTDHRMVPQNRKPPSAAHADRRNLETNEKTCAKIENKRQLPPEAGWCAHVRVQRKQRSPPLPAVSLMTLLDCSPPRDPQIRRSHSRVSRSLTLVALRCRT